jgi:adenylosuccinate synthase
MTVTIVGSQLGDEGKGGIVDLYSDAADVVVRYQGGDNAGHTVVAGGAEYKLSLVPSGVVRGKTGVLGNGCVVNPRTLFDEIDDLRDRGLDPDVRVARRAHVILPYHRVLAGVEVDAKSDSGFDAGTTGRGIGPTYEDKAARRGVRVGDLLDPEVLRRKLEYVVPQKRALVEGVFGLDPATLDATDGFESREAFDVVALYETYREYGERLADEEMTVNASAFLADALDGGKAVMMEGAQGSMLDIDHGDFPSVTSSNPTAGGASTGTGLPPAVVGGGDVVGVVKAYLSRVGTGPMPTELGGVEGQTPGYTGEGEAQRASEDRAAEPRGEGEPDEEELATFIREAGGEYGTVTGRPRRVGWLDVPMLRHAARVSGFSAVAINHLDTLAGLAEVKVAHVYDLDGETVHTVPATTERWADCEPVYRTFDGWPEFDAGRVARDGYDALPSETRAYVEYLEDELGAPAIALGVGPGREETVVRSNPFE